MRSFIEIGPVVTEKLWLDCMHIFVHNSTRGALRTKFDKLAFGTPRFFPALVVLTRKRDGKGEVIRKDRLGQGPNGDYTHEKFH